MTTSPHTLEEEISGILSLYGCDPELTNEETTETLLFLIKTVGEDLIGRDEVYQKGFGQEIDGRNELRSEQRQALEDIISGKEKII